MIDMTVTDADIVVVGAGLNGLVLAQALIQSGWDTLLIDQHPAYQGHASTNNDLSSDERSTALSLGTIHFLESLGVWTSVKHQAEPIENIAIIEEDPGSPNEPPLVYHHDLISPDPMGFNVRNAHFTTCLWNILQVQQGLKSIFGHKVQKINPNNLQQNIQITLDNNKILTTRLVIAADGRFSTLRNLAQIQTHSVDYRQSALVTHFHHSDSHQQWAFEIFYPHGPLAFLPAFCPDPSHFRSSLIWSERPEFIRYLMKLSDRDFMDHLQHRLQHRLGDMVSVESRRVYGLQRVLAKHVVAPRLVLLGDAAHALHPIAGQGLNLGIRDSKTLVDVLNHTRSLGMDYGREDVLERYEHQRQSDTVSMAAMTHGLNQFFRYRSKPLQKLRHWGMTFLNHTPSLKRPLVYHAMGLAHMTH